MVMGNNNAEVISRIRSPFVRERVKDSLSFFKLQTRSHADRRKVNDRRSPHRKGYLAHIPERRSNMVGRRINGDRRGMISRYYEYFVGKSATVFKRKYFNK
jgi:hypothetical protein